MIKKYNVNVFYLQSVASFSSCRTISMWNKLPQNVVSIGRVEHFRLNKKTGLNNINISKTQ